MHYGLFNKSSDETTYECHCLSKSESFYSIINIIHKYDNIFELNIFPIMGLSNDLMRRSNDTLYIKPGKFYVDTINLSSKEIIILNSKIDTTVFKNGTTYNFIKKKNFQEQVLMVLDNKGIPKHTVSNSYLLSGNWVLKKHITRSPYNTYLYYITNSRDAIHSPYIHKIAIDSEYGILFYQYVDSERNIFNCTETQIKSKLKI